jgi:hypothetical protein
MNSKESSPSLPCTSENEDFVVSIPAAETLKLEQEEKETEIDNQGEGNRVFGPHLAKKSIF